MNVAMQIPVEVTDEELSSLFSPYGQIVEVHRHNKPGQPIGAQRQAATYTSMQCMKCTGAAIDNGL
jgi:hypothetical protein